MLGNGSQHVSPQEAAVRSGKLWLIDAMKNYTTLSPGGTTRQCVQTGFQRVRERRHAQKLPPNVRPMSRAAFSESRQQKLQSRVQHVKARQAQAAAKRDARSSTSGTTVLPSVRSNKFAFLRSLGERRQPNKDTATSLPEVSTRTKFAVPSRTARANVMGLPVLPGQTRHARSPEELLGDLRWSREIAAARQALVRGFSPQNSSPLRGNSPSHRQDVGAKLLSLSPRPNTSPVTGVPPLNLGSLAGKVSALSPDRRLLQAQREHRDLLEPLERQRPVSGPSSRGRGLAPIVQVGGHNNRVTLFFSPGSETYTVPHSPGTSPTRSPAETVKAKLKERVDASRRQRLLGRLRIQSANAALGSRANTTGTGKPH